MRSASKLRTPLLGVVTCGPSEQMDQLKSRLSGELEVEEYVVPHLGPEERNKFINWFSEHTGKNPDLTTISQDNPLLVQLMFELAQNQRIPEFAQRFRQRLELLDVFEITRVAMAVNALYIDAPATLISREEQRYALHQLAIETQQHFTIPADETGQPKGIRLAHAHLAWLLFYEWINHGKMSAEQAWAMDLHRAIEISLQAGCHDVANEILARLLYTGHVSRGSRKKDPLQLTCGPFFKELYLLHVRAHGGQPVLSLLHRWMELAESWHLQPFVPDPAECAARAIHACQDSQLSGDLVFWVWHSAKNIINDKRSFLLDKVKKFALRYPEREGVALAIARIAQNAVFSPWEQLLLVDWLSTQHLHPLAYEAIAVRLKHAPPSDIIIDQARAWLRLHQGDHAAARVVAVALASANPRVPSIVNELVRWVDTHASSPHAGAIVETLVSKNPKNGHLLIWASHWIDKQSDNPSSFAVFRPLLKVMRFDVSLVEKALEKLSIIHQNDMAAQVLAVLICGIPNNQTVISTAINWIKERRPKAKLIRTMLRIHCRNDPAVQSILHIDGKQINNSENSSTSELLMFLREQPGDLLAIRRAIKEIKGNRKLRAVADMLKTVSKRNPQNDEIVIIASQWIQAHPEIKASPDIIGALVSANPQSQQALEFAVKWVHSNTEHRGIQSVVVPLLRALPENPHLIRFTLSWLNSHPEHPGFATVLSALIRAPHIEASAIQLAEQYLGSSKRIGRLSLLNALNNVKGINGHRGTK